MSIKRLKHHVYTLGQMFCGWELMFDYKRLADLGEGTIKIDLLTGDCFLGEEPITALRIAGRLQDWFQEDLEQYRIDSSRLDHVELFVRFTTRRQLGQTIQRTSWNDSTPHFIHCLLECRGSVQAGPRKFTSEYAGEHEWPESYSWIKEAA